MLECYLPCLFQKKLLLFIIPIFLSSACSDIAFSPFTVFLGVDEGATGGVKTPSISF